MKTTRHRGLTLLTIAVLAALAVPVTAKGQGSTDSEHDRVVIVDDEECGCELYFVDGIQTTQSDGLFGFKREDGSIIIEPTYRFVDQFHGNYCIVYHDYERCGLIDRDGREVIPVEMEEVNYPTDGMIRVRKGGLYGYYDITGRQVIDFQYRAASGFSEGVATVAIDFDSLSFAYGYIDHNNNLVIPAEFEYAYPFQEGYAVAQKYGRIGMIDHNGNTVLPFKYEDVSGMMMGFVFAVDVQTEKAAMFDSKFHRLTDFVYDDLIGYADGYFTMHRDGKCVYVNHKGQEKFGEYDIATQFMNGFAMVSRGNKYGIMSNKGKMILPIEYDNSGYRSMEYIFSEGLAMIEKDGKYGFVDTKGKIVIPLEYESAQHCTEGLIPVQKNGMWGFVDRNGKLFIDYIFDAASFFEWGRAEVVYNGTVYKINPDGKCVKNCKTFPRIF